MKRLMLIITILVSVLLVNAQEPVRKSLPVDTSYTVSSSWKKFAREYPEARPVLPLLPAGVKEYRDKVYLRIPDTPFGPRDLHVDLFRPDAPGNLPAVVMIHGGGWRSGNKSLQHPLAMNLAARGFVTLAVEYQLSPEARYPSALHNIKAALRWARANAAQFGIDTSRMAISGCSAGGHLAALTGLTNGVASFEGKLGITGHSSLVQAIIDIDGVVDFLAPASLNLNRTPESADVTWLGGTFTEKPEIWKEASPAFHAHGKSVPMLFLNSGFPRFHAGQDELAGMLREWDIYHEIHTFDIQVHPFWLFHPWFEPTVSHMASFLYKTLNVKTSAQTVPGAQPIPDSATLTVAQDGSGDYRTVGEAIEACRALQSAEKVIFVKNGIYKEKIVIESWLTHLTIKGETKEGTIISWDDYAAKNNMGTFRTYTLKVLGNDITIENLTVENCAGQVGQAVALHVEGDRFTARNCRLIGDQDTLYATGQGSRQFYENCYIEGTTDFIFGSATALFSHCVIHSKKDSYVTAASTPQESRFGYVFRECRLTAEDGVTRVYLGRPWRDFAKTIFLDCTLGAHILPQGWHNWSQPQREKTAFYGEYQSSGPGAAPSLRVSWSHQLTEVQANEYTPANIFYRESTWMPANYIKP